MSLLSLVNYICFFAYVIVLSPLLLFFFYQLNMDKAFRGFLQKWQEPVNSGMLLKEGIVNWSETWECISVNEPARYWVLHNDVFEVKIRCMHEMCGREDFQFAVFPLENICHLNPACRLWYLNSFSLQTHGNLKQEGIAEFCHSVNGIHP